MRKQVSITLHESLMSAIPSGQRSRVIEAALVQYLKLDPITLGPAAPAAPKPVTQQPTQVAPVAPPAPRREDYDDEADYYQDLGEWTEAQGD